MGAFSGTAYGPGSLSSAYRKEAGYLVWVPGTVMNGMPIGPPSHRPEPKSAWNPREAPIVFTSVTEKQRIHRTMELAMKVFEARKQRIATRKLNDVMLPEIERLPPPMYKSKSVNIKYVTQLPGTVPAFAFFTNLPQYVKESYTRFLENKLREHFDFHGVPVRVFYRKK